APRGPRPPVTVQIDFDGLSQRVISVPGVPERQYTELHAGVDGIVYHLEAASGRGQGGGGGGFAGGSELWRYRLGDRMGALFVNGVAAYEVSADGHKLLYRAAGGGGGG